MGILKFLVLSFGAFIVAGASECLPETAKCSEFWTKIEPHRNLWETEKDLNSWCRTQDRFYKCLEDVLLKDKKGNLAYLPVNLLISKLFAKDLCSDGSHSRRRALDNARCMNNMNTDYCSLPEYLDIVSPDDAIPESRCSFSEKTFSCIAATLVLNCGFDAGRVYRNMLKITRYSDEVCGIEVTEGIPPCDEEETLRVKKADRMSRIYDGIARRIGSIPEQEDEMQSLSKELEVENEFEVDEALQEYLDGMRSAAVQENEIQDSSDEAREQASKRIMGNEVVIKVIQEYLDRIGSVPELEIKDSSNEAQSSLKEAQIQDESEQIDINQAMNEAVRGYLDRMGSVADEDNEISDSSKAVKGMGIVSELENQIQDSSKTQELELIQSNQAVTKVMQEYLDRIGSVPELENEIQDSSEELKVRSESETIRANKVVTEALKNACKTLDNAMAEEYRTDYMMADESPHSNVDEKSYMNPLITDIFRGILFYNYSDVEYALYWRQPDFTVIEKITCKQVAPFIGYVLGCIAMYRYNDPDCLSKSAVHERVTPELIRDLDPEVPDSIEFGHRPIWMKDFDDAYEAKRSRNLASSLEELFQETESPAKSTATTVLHIFSKMMANNTRKWWDVDWMGKHTNSILPNDVHLELMELLFPEPEKFDPPATLMFKYDDFNYVFLYDPTFLLNVERVTCSRLDECHPRGRGLWKCKITVRKTKTCGECNRSTETDEESNSIKETEYPTTSSGLHEFGESSAETENVEDYDSSLEYDQPDDDYLNDEYLSEEDELSEKELKEAIADEINYKLETETDKQLKNDFRLLLLDSVLHPSRYESASKHADETDVHIEDDEDSEWDKFPEDEFEDVDEDVVVIEPLSEEKSNVKYETFESPDVAIKN